MAQNLRDTLLGARTWHALEPATRTFLASAEAVFRARRDDPRLVDGKEADGKLQTLLEDSAPPRRFHQYDCPYFRE